MSLINHTKKVMERMVYKRLFYVLENNGRLNKNQYGFRKYRSTQDCLTIFHSDTKRSLINGENLYGTFFDLEKAFDNIRQQKILETLHNFFLNWL